MQQFNKAKLKTKDVRSNYKKKKERRKWIHVFDNVSCLVFAVSLLGYDESLWEDPQLHLPVSERYKRITEALALFSSIVNMDCFQSVPIILLFTKKGMQTTN